MHPGRVHSYVSACSICRNHQKSKLHMLAYSFHSRMPKSARNRGTLFLKNLRVSIWSVFSFQSDLSCNCELSNVQIADMFHVDSFDLIEPNQYISFDARTLSMRPGDAGPSIPLGGGFGPVLKFRSFLELCALMQCQYCFLSRVAQVPAS